MEFYTLGINIYVLSLGLGSMKPFLGRNFDLWMQNIFSVGLRCCLGAWLQRPPCPGTWVEEVLVIFRGVQLAGVSPFSSEASPGYTWNPHFLGRLRFGGGRRGL